MVNVTLPASGGTYAQLQQPALNPAAVIKARIANILVRDYRNADGSIFNLASPSVGLNANGVFTPFAADGSLRSDLLASAPGANLGFYNLGHLKGDGIKGTQEFSSDETDSAQTLYPIRIDPNKDGISLSFTPREVNAISLALAMELPLNSNPSQMIAMGQAQLSVAAPADSPLVERVIIALCFDGQGNRFAITLPRTGPKKKGGFNLNRKDTVIGDYEAEGLLDPNVGTTYIYSQDGSSWRAQAGSPIWALAVPTATALAGKTATVAFTAPNDPLAPSELFTFSVNQVTPAGVPAVSNTATIPVPSAPTVTTSGTAGTTNYFYKAVVHTANGTVTSAEGTIATGNATLSSSNYNIVSFTLPAGGVTWDLYRGSTTGSENLLVASGLTGTSFNDNGGATSSATPPVTNTATISAPVATATFAPAGGSFPSGLTEFYKVSAITAAGETTPSTEVSVVTSGTTGSVALAWAQVPGATGYRIYRGTAAGAEIVLVQAIGSGSTVSFTDTGSIQPTVATVTQSPTGAQPGGAAVVDTVTGPLTVGATYAFQVVATGQLNNATASSAWSNVVTALT